MQLSLESFASQNALWPGKGHHILANYDDSSIVVYQAYRPSIGQYAIRHHKLGGPDFSFTRMSWVKPNFLWMMYRSGWGTKEGQEVVLGLRVSRRFFDSLLESAVVSSYDPHRYASLAEWKCALESSEVRLQWDPDHLPDGTRTERRAIQLGLRGEALLALSSAELLEVLDMTDLVAAQRAVLKDNPEALLTPRERVYLPDSETARQHAGLN